MYDADGRILCGAGPSCEWCYTNPTAPVPSEAAWRGWCGDCRREHYRKQIADFPSPPRRHPSLPGTNYVARAALNAVLNRGRDDVRRWLPRTVPLTWWLFDDGEGWDDRWKGAKVLVLMAMFRFDAIPQALLGYDFIHDFLPGSGQHQAALRWLVWWPTRTRTKEIIWTPRVGFERIERGSSSPRKPRSLAAPSRPIGRPRKLTHEETIALASEAHRLHRDRPELSQLDIVYELRLIVVDEDEEKALGRSGVQKAEETASRKLRRILADHPG